MEEEKEQEFEDDEWSLSEDEEHPEEADHPIVCISQVSDVVEMCVCLPPA
jgi:hypothetical protein